MILGGVIPIVAMPYLAGGDIDEESLRREVGWLCAIGVDGIGLARASEFPRLSEAERRDVIGITVEEVAGRLPVVVHVGAESARTASAFMSTAKELGADALMISAPAFEVFPGRGGQEAYFSMLVEQTRLPVVLQDIPSARLEMSVVRSLLERFGGQISLKLEVPPTLPAIERAVDEFGSDLRLFGGAGGGMFLWELQRGAVGSMPGAPIADLFVEVWRAFNAEGADAASPAFQKILSFCAFTTVPGLILSFYREVLALRGVFASAATRAPEAALTERERDELVALLRKLDISTPGPMLDPIAYGSEARHEN